AVKTGMLANAEVVAAVADSLRQAKIEKIVVDPVMVATSGDPLLAADAVDVMCAELFPLAAVVTPNLDEAARLLSGQRANNREEMLQQAHQIAERGASAVLLKGGHLAAEPAGEAADVLIQGNDVRWLTAERIETANTHGTGCTLASAIAAGLAKGLSLEQSAEEAKAYLTRALKGGVRLDIGHGAGPVDHLI
ncbi:MAG: bifunctional hydroxymethylpyrimidine kinase/phosphomethylpyrimidine kinase, partial [Hyphomicrobiaceae bacterium]